MLPVLDGCVVCALTTHAFLARLDSNVVDGLNLLHRKRDYARGDALFRRGEPADAVFCITDAVVCLSRRAGPGGRRSVVGVVGGGGVVGLSAALHPDAVYLCDADITAGGAACTFRRGDLLALADHHPQLGLVLAGEVAREAARGMRQAALLAHPRLEPRLAAVLLELAHPGHGGAPRVSDGLSRSDLAGLCGVGREAVARCLSRWRASGWVRTSRGPITLLDPDALRRCAEGG